VRSTRTAAHRRSPSRAAEKDQRFGALSVSAAPRFRSGYLSAFLGGFRGGYPSGYLSGFLGGFLGGFRGGYLPITILRTSSPFGVTSLTK
jgi:fructose-specific phosphotransferase system IIC component